jgi:hypothetical protein
MTKLALSDDLVEITAEINIYKQQAGQAVFEIGKRLKHVKDNDLAHGQWLSWLESVDIRPRTAQAMIQAYEQFGNTQHAALLPTGKIFEMLSLPESVDRQQFIEQPHTIPSTGEQKTVNEMSRDELREVKKALQEAERAKAEAEKRAEQAQHSAAHYEKLWNQAKNQPPIIKTKTEVIEKIPDDYNDLKEAAAIGQKLNNENVQLKRMLDEQKSRYESMLSNENYRKQNIKDLKKVCGEMVSSFAQYRKLVMMAFRVASNEREASQIFDAFIREMDEEVRLLFDEIKKETAIKAV